MKRPKLTYNSRLNWLLLAPPIIFGLQAIVGLYMGNTSITWLQVVTVLSITYLYVVQLRYMKQKFPDRKFLFQFVIMLVALVLPLLGLLAGDHQGAAAYNTPPSYLADFPLGLGLGAGVALLFMYVFAMGNALFIHTEGKSKALSIVGNVFYVLGYLVVAAVTWIVYGFVYSLHDPSTE